MAERAGLDAKILKEAANTAENLHAFLSFNSRPKSNSTPMQFNNSMMSLLNQIATLLNSHDDGAVENPNDFSKLRFLQSRVKEFLQASV